MIEDTANLVVRLSGGFWKWRKIARGCNHRFLRKIYLRIHYLYLQKYGAFIGHHAHFDSEPCFPHNLFGIFIAGGARIGNNCVIFHQVTIGANSIPFSKGVGSPTIGNDCYIGAGAMIVGAVKIGDNCRIGANCVVTVDVPPNSIVVSEKCRIIPRNAPMMNRYYRWSPEGPIYFDQGKWVLERDTDIINSLKNGL